MSIRYKEVADIVIAKVEELGGEAANVDAELQKVAEEHELNKDEQQRVVEEYNVGVFLKKLANGTQFEDFPLASQITTEPKVNIKPGHEKKLEKTASAVVGINDSMFNLNEQDDFMFQFADTGDYNEDSYIMTTESKWTEQDKARDEADLLTKEAEELSSLSNATHNFYYMFAEKIKGNPNLVKTAIMLVQKEDQEILNVLADSTSLTDMEISEGVVSKDSAFSLRKIASELLDDAENGTGVITKGKEKVGKHFPFKNKTTAKLLVGGGLLTAGGLGAYKALKSDREIHTRNDLITDENPNS